jgi:hypothetical protein
LTTYYVSPSGNNANNGLSALTPWLTLGYANSNTIAGDSILHLSGGTWDDQYYSIGHQIALDVYNGSVAAIFDFDSYNPGTDWAVISLGGANSTVNLIDIRNNRSGNDHTDGGRGIEFNASGITITNCRIANTEGIGLIRNFGGDDITVEDTILEQIAQGYSGGTWSGGMTAAGDSNPVDNFTVRRCQVFEVYGEAISAFTFNATNRCTGIVFEDNDVFAAAAAGIYLNGVNGAIARRNTVLGTTDTNYHRVTGYVGYGLGMDNESTSNSTNNNTKWYLNLVAYCSPGFYVGRGVGTAITNMYVAHNTWIDCDKTIYTSSGAGDFTGAGNIFRQNASILITGGTAHDDGSQVPSNGVWDLDENYWEGGGEHANLNHASDFSDSAWQPFKTSGWQSIADFDDITVEDWRPTTEANGTQFTNPDTSANFADFEGEADFVEAGALASNPEEPPTNPPDPPATPATPEVFGKLFTPPRTAPLNSGQIIPGAQLHFYRTGLTTEQASYTDKDCRIPHANPVVANSAGEFPRIYLNPDSGYDYRVKLTDRDGNQLWLEDDVVVELADEAKLIQGTFIGIQTGYAANLNPTISYRIIKDDDGTGIATLRSGTSTGTSNSTGMTLTNIPTALQPTRNAFCACILHDNTTNLMGAALVSGSSITFYIDEPLSAAGFTNSNVKGLPAGWTITYQL